MGWPGISNFIHPVVVSILTFEDQTAIYQEKWKMGIDEER